MNQIICTVFLIAFFTSACCLEQNSEEEELLDVIVDKEVNRVGEQAVRVGQILRECAKGIEVRVKHTQGLENETTEYIFRRLWEGVKNVLQRLADGVSRASEGLNFVTKAAEVISDVVAKKIGTHSLSDNEVSYSDFMAELGKDIDRLGESLIQKGTELCGTCRLKALGDIEKKFVQNIVGTL